jgi:predicted DNA-binding transcriptional regulator
MKSLITILALLIFAGCSTDKNRTLDDILDSTFRVYQISGFDAPNIDIKQDSLAQFLVALHYNIPISEIERKLEWSPETTESHIDALIQNKLLARNGDDLQPTLGIFTQERGNLMEKKAQNVAKEIADSITAWLPEIKEIHNESNISQRHDFSELSLFYLSNVILDNFQIRQVEEQFLNQERPLRNGSRYYLGIVEDDLAADTEPYGMYGNRGLHWSDSIGISVYGNRRTASNPGWDNYEDKKIHVFDEHDTEMITQTMPDLFFPTLLDILNRNRPDFEATYKELNFDEEISFEEFFIFWYHWIYTEATDVLIEREIVQESQDEMFYYQRAVNF